MLYVHMAVLLNDLFFPKTDPHTASLLTAFAFCSTYVLRPIGALIFGWIGDHIGRKTTVIITSFMMALSCLMMANLPTYAQIGILASWIVTICRILQGMASMGEIIGAELYVTEITKPPLQYPIVAVVSICATLGGTIALAVGTLVTSSGFNWRVAFWFGMGIALIGSIARTVLRETPDFVNAKLKLQNSLKKFNQNNTVVKDNIIINEKVNLKTSLSLFLIKCAQPVGFYFAYIFCGDILKHSFNFSSEQVIYQNFKVSILQLVGSIFLTCLSYKIYPLIILRIKLIVFFSVSLICPYLLNNIKSPLEIFFIQSVIMFFSIDNMPALPILFAHLPVFKRFTYASFTYALSRIVMYLVTSFGLIYLTKLFGNGGLLLIMLPVSLAYFLGLRHFELLEKESGNYPQKHIPAF